LSIQERVEMVRLGRPSIATDPRRVKGGSLGRRKISSALERRATRAAASGCRGHREGEGEGEGGGKHFLRVEMGMAVFGWWEAGWIYLHAATRRLKHNLVLKDEAQTIVSHEEMRDQ
jgi:hypothetical protein